MAENSGKWNPCELSLESKKEGGPGSAVYSRQAQMPEIALETMSTNCGYNIKVKITPRSTLFHFTLHLLQHETEIWKTRNCRPGRWSSGSRIASKPNPKVTESDAETALDVGWSRVSG